MKFVSYAQNHEDVMLWRALKHVERGFYIDIGANDPDIDSVTKAFYERGWSGINVEPLPSHHADLKHARPRDINLQCAVGETSGEMELWEYDVRGWATAAADVLEQHKRDGLQGRAHRVHVTTLSAICQTHVHGDIHFLKVDVEGFEKSVLAGADFKKYRPWILVIEATKPNSTEEAFEDWEPLLITSGYQFSFFDGLNRYYVAEERSDLKNSFRSPACVFDNFISQEQRRLEVSLEHALLSAQRADERIAVTELRATHAMTDADLARKQLRQALIRLNELESSSARLQEILDSKTWRLTEPIRCTATAIKKSIKMLATPLLTKGMKLVLSNPNLKKHLSKLIKRVPSLARRFHLIAIRRGLVEAPDILKQDTYTIQDTRSSNLISITSHIEQVKFDLRRSAGRTDKPKA